MAEKPEREEHWKYIEGSDDCWVSDLGNMRHHKAAITQYPDAEGYMRARATGYGRDRVHRFVARAFLDPPTKKERTMINHIDGVKDHNWVENLEWCTVSENMQHAIDHGLYDPNKKRKGRIVCTKIIDTCTHESYVFESQAEASEKLNISAKEINNCLRAKSFTTHGYIFGYMNEDFKHFEKNVKNAFKEKKKKEKRK